MEDAIPGPPSIGCSLHNLPKSYERGAQFASPILPLPARCCGISSEQCAASSLEVGPSRRRGCPRYGARHLSWFQVAGHSIFTDLMLDCPTLVVALNLGALADGTREMLITTAQAKPHEVLVRVKNSGPGLAADNRRRASDRTSIFRLQIGRTPRFTSGLR